jgi:hypothetical protein
MKKALLVGVIVSVLALSAIGAAFATGFEGWDDIGYLAAGGQDIPENLDVTSVRYSTTIAGDPQMLYVSDVQLTFDKDLHESTDIGVALVDDNDTDNSADDIRYGEGTKHLDSVVNAGDTITINLSTWVAATDVYFVDEVQVIVAE